MGFDMDLKDHAYPRRSVVGKLRLMKYQEDSDVINYVIINEN